MSKLKQAAVGLMAALAVAAFSSGAAQAAHFGGMGGGRQFHSHKIDVAAAFRRKPTACDQTIIPMARARLLDARTGTPRSSEVSDP